MVRYILDVNELRGVTVVLIDHMDVVMDISIGSRCSTSASSLPTAVPTRCTVTRP
jgi:hypothetical protein